MKGCNGPRRPSWALASVCDGKLEFSSAFGGRTPILEAFATVVVVYGSAPDAPLHDHLKDSGPAASPFLVASVGVPPPLADRLPAVPVVLPVT